LLEIVVCEDNNEYRKVIIENLNHVIRDQNIDGSIVLDCASPEQVESFIKVNNPNVFFLDIDLNAKMSGLDLASIIHEKFDDAYIVFISQYANLVFKSFKVRPFDFLPKPITKKDLLDVLTEINNDYLKNFNIKKPELLHVKIGNIIYQIPKDEIVFMEKFGNKCIIHSTTKTVYCYQSLDAIGDELEKEAFIRCHKSFIVNKYFIDKINLSDMEITLKNGQKCFIGGKYKKNLVNELGNMLKR